MDSRRPTQGHKCSPECWYVAKRNGRMVRMRNRCTGLWDDWMRQPSEATAGQEES